MKSRTTVIGYLLSIEPGEEIIEILITFARQKNITAGTFTAIGAVSAVELGYYELLEKQYHWKQFDGTIEIASAMGNIAWLHEDPIVHMHGVFSGADFNAFAGHVKSAIVSAACEIVLTTHADKLERKFNEYTGLNLWDCEITEN